jgi:uncharacterized protein Yka (UPF0111/DUF47 family)
MDEETKAAFAALDARFDALMTRVNDLSERIIDAITALKTDHQNTKAFLLEDAIVLGQRLRSLENRVDRIERKPD